MAKGPGLRAALQVLEDYSIPYLMRSENYRTLEHAISNGETLTCDQMKHVLQILAHDLQLDTKYSASILKILSFILKTIKEQEIVQAELLATATCVMEILSRTAPLHKVQSLQQLCLEVLVAYPDQQLAMLGRNHAADLFSLQHQYLSSTNIETDIQAMMIDILLRVIKVLPAEDLREFVMEGLSVWFSRVVPLIFTSAALREKAVTITEKIIPYLQTIDYSDNPQWNTVFKSISTVDKYPAVLKTMLTNGDKLWHRAWCCVIQLLGTKLHKSANLINSLLAVLENAFKMNMTDRCKAFHCWNYVIENFSLNMEQFFTSRKIRLLLIPLIVNNAKDENSAYAKFNTWWLLLGKLQPQIEPYLHSIIMPFLVFCFGQPGPRTTDKPAPIVPGLRFPKVQKLVIQALVEMVGHSECSGCVDGDFKKICQPMLKASNLATHFNHWMHAIKESTLLIVKLMHEQATQNVSCLWISLLKCIGEIEDHSKQEIVLKELFIVLSELVTLSPEIETLADLIFNVILQCIFANKTVIVRLIASEKSSDETSFKHICKLALCPSFKKFYSTSDPKINNSLRVLTDLGILNSKGFYKWFLQELLTDEHSLAWWTSLVNSIINNQCHIPEHSSKDILIWPITKLEYFTEVDMAAETWSCMYKFTAPKLQPDSQLHMEVLNILMLHYSDTPVANKFAFRILPLTINSILENDSNKVVSMEKELGILSELSRSIHELCIGDDNYKIDIINSLSRIFTSLSQQSNVAVAKYVVLIADNVLKNVLHSQETVQGELGNNVKGLMTSIKKFYSNKSNTFLAAELEETLSNCTNIDNPVVKKLVFKIINSLLSNGYQSELFSSIIDNQNVSHINYHVNEEESCAVKFSTPKNKSISKNTKSASKIIKKVIEGNEEFVVVKSNWKFNPHNLTEHQKEVLNKKREDIPALYQDLSQSQDEPTFKTWKMPGYRSDSQDVSSSISEPCDQIYPKILKDIPNPEFSPNIITATPKDEDTKDEDNQSFKGKLELMKENSEIKQLTSPVQKPKQVSSKSPRISLKDRITKNVQNLLANNIETQIISSAIVSPMNKTVNSQDLTPERILYNNAAFSAPPKLDSERPSRIKRKPKKLEADFEIPEVFKKTRMSIDSENKTSSKENNESQKSAEPAEVHVEQKDIDIMTVKDESTVGDPVTDAKSTCNLPLPEVVKIDIEKNSPFTPIIKQKNPLSERKSSSKKKNRLELQLAIDTVEGHPLLTPKEQGRSTRKSRTLNECSTSKKNCGERSNATKIRQSTKNDNIAENESVLHDHKSVNLVETPINSKSSSPISSVDMPNTEDFIESSQESPLPSLSVKTSRKALQKKSSRKSLMPNSKSTDSCSTSDSESDAGLAGKQNSVIIIKSKEDNTAITENNPSFESCINKAPDLLNTQDNISFRTNQSLSDETVAEMDTQPYVEIGIEVNSIDIISKEERNKKATADELLVPNIDNNNALNAFVQNTISDDTTAEMDTVPFIPSDDVIIADANISNKFPDMLNVDTDSEITACADTEPVPSLCISDDKLECKPIKISDEEEENPDLPIDVSFNNQEINENNVFLSNNSLCSPLKDNKKRNNEFLNNTLDISPIKIGSPDTRVSSPVTDDNSNDYVIVSLISPVKINEEPLEKCDSPEIFTNEKISPEKMDHSPPRNELMSSTGSPSSSLSLKKNRSQVRQTSRGAQMLGLCNPGNLFPNAVSHPENIGESEESKRTPVITPARRNLKIAYNNESESNVDEVKNHIDNFLSFTKALPSACSSPAGPILKRKHADITDESTISPASKRKRVSFHDPPVSTTVSVQKYIEDSCVRSPQQSTNKNKERKNRPLVVKSLAKKLENEYLENVEKGVPEVPTTDDEEVLMDDTEMNSMPETPQAEIITNHVLNVSEPMYPDLVNCTDPIANISEELSTDSMKGLFIKDTGNIATIGDLAKLTELEVNRLSIKTPKVETVKRVLANYYAKCLQTHVPELTGTSSIDVQIQTEFEEEFLWITLKDQTSKEVIETCLEKKPDFIEEFSKIISMDAKQKITNALPTCAISDIFCERLKDTAGESTDKIFTVLAHQYPEKLLDKTFQEFGSDSISEKLGLDSIEEYLLKKLSPGELVKFCSTIMQKKIPSEK